MQVSGPKSSAFPTTLEDRGEGQGTQMSRLFRPEHPRPSSTSELSTMSVTRSVHSRHQEARPGNQGVSLGGQLSAEPGSQASRALMEKHPCLGSPGLLGLWSQDAVGNGQWPRRGPGRPPTALGERAPRGTFLAACGQEALVVWGTYFGVRLLPLPAPASLLCGVQRLGLFPTSPCRGGTMPWPPGVPQGSCRAFCCFRGPIRPHFSLSEHSPALVVLSIKPEITEEGPGLGVKVGLSSGVPVWQLPCPLLLAPHL